MSKKAYKQRTFKPTSHFCPYDYVNDLMMYRMLIFIYYSINSAINGGVKKNQLYMLILHHYTISGYSITVYVWSKPVP